MAIPTVFEHFGPLLEACGEYMQSSGYRFSLEDERDEVTNAVIEVYRSRLIDEKEPALLHEFHTANRIVSEEAYFHSMKAVCQSIDLWQANPAYPAERVHWQDMKNQSMEAVAAQLYNYMQIRNESEETILSASFIGDFGEAFGLTMDKATNKKYQKKSKVFFKKATKYAKKNSKEVDTTNVSERFNQWIEKNPGVVMGVAGGLAALAGAYMISKKFRK